MTYCVLIPHYNHAAQLRGFLPQLIAAGLPLIIVDDGSDEQNFAALVDATQNYADIEVIRHVHNRGKGAAVMSGWYYARARGFDYAVQIDADGQHNAADIAVFVQHSQAAPQTVICGRPRFDHSVPKVRLYGRRITDFWVMLETWSCKIKDGLCGFRVYPLAQCEHVLDRHYLGPRMDFDTEFLVKCLWENIALEFIDTPVVYPQVSVSHFRYLEDNLNLIRLHTRLMLGMLWRAPALFWRMLRSAV